MKQLRTSLLIILSVLALAIFSFLASALSGNLNMGWNFGFYNYEVVSDKSYDSDDIDKINISFSSDRVDLLRNTEDKIRVVEYMSEKPTENELAQVSADGSIFNILTGDRNFFLWKWNWYSRVEIYLPKSYTSSLSVKTTSENINTELALNLKEADFKSSSGDIHFNEIIADNINIQTTSGNIKGNSVSTSDKDKEISIQTSSGTIGVNYIKGNKISLKTTSESIRGDIIESTGDVKIESSSGTISYNTIKGNYISLKTTSESIRGDKIESSGDVKIESSSGTISYNTIKGNYISLKTTSESIRGDKIESSGNVEIRSSSGSINYSNIKGNCISLKTTSESIHGDKIEGSGDVDIESSSGTINYNNIIADCINLQTNSETIQGNTLESRKNITIKSSSGSIRFTEAKGFQTITSTSGSISIDSATVGGIYKSSSGDITVNFADLTDKLKINSTSGSVRLSLPGDVAYKLSAKANSGSVSADFNREVDWDDKLSHSVECSVGENPQNSVDIQTSSGSIKVNEN